MSAKSCRRASRRCAPSARPAGLAGPTAPPGRRSHSQSPHPHLLPHSDQVGILDLGIEGHQLGQRQPIPPGQGPQSIPWPQCASGAASPSRSGSGQSPDGPPPQRGPPARCKSCSPPKRRRSSAHSRAWGPALPAGRRNRCWPPATGGGPAALALCHKRRRPAAGTPGKPPLPRTPPLPPSPGAPPPSPGADSGRRGSCGPP